VLRLAGRNMELPLPLPAGVASGVFSVDLAPPHVEVPSNVQSPPITAETGECFTRFVPIRAVTCGGSTVTGRLCTALFHAAPADPASTSANVPGSGDGAGASANAENVPLTNR
jgi:hypothetical protein